MPRICVPFKNAWVATTDYLALKTTTQFILYKEIATIYEKRENVQIEILN